MIADMTDHDDEHTCTPTERRNAKRYRTELFAAVAVYVVLLLVSLFTVDRTSGALKVVTAVLPMGGILAMSAAFVRFTLRIDEFQRQTFCIAGSIAGLTGAVVTMLLGFLENAGAPRISMTFAIALPFVRRRFR
jgi:hypothetical protein